MKLSFSTRNTRYDHRFSIRPDIHSDFNYSNVRLGSIVLLFDLEISLTHAFIRSHRINLNGISVIGSSFRNDSIHILIRKSPDPTRIIPSDFDFIFFSLLSLSFNFKYLPPSHRNVNRWRENIWLFAIGHGLNAPRHSHYAVPFYLMFR